jgi:hypothetical protein
MCWKILNRLLKNPFYDENDPVQKVVFKRITTETHGRIQMRTEFSIFSMLFSDIPCPSVVRFIFFIILLIKAELIEIRLVHHGMTPPQAGRERATAREPVIGKRRLILFRFSHRILWTVPPRAGLSFGKCSAIGRTTQTKTGESP